MFEKIKELFISDEKTETKGEGSKNIAKERLQFILVQDRIKLSPQQMEEMKAELLDVIKKYIDVDDNDIEMDISREEEMMAMIANFPLKKRE
ncbi:cell division topological specificity factor MinE [Halanaerobiaceae bacterium Z-7014]|uniref:Cell division topological specificity factor n=1 Tax=Halonatronomonas betaini TaxID=2778430 RepID=A0A931ANG7_9FIRM|nr:cell division topological specificity factor MinE [Halonatronomonas betaini]